MVTGGTANYKNCCQVISLNRHTPFPWYSCKNHKMHCHVFVLTGLKYEFRNKNLYEKMSNAKLIDDNLLCRISLFISNIRVYLPK